jgi:hypothetical protein
MLTMFPYASAKKHVAFYRPSELKKMITYAAETYVRTVGAIATQAYPDADN